MTNEFLLFIYLCKDNFLPKLVFVYVELYYLQLFTIIAYHLNAICHIYNYI